VIDRVVVTVCRPFLEIDAQPGRQFRDFLELPGDAEIACPEIVDVLLDELGRIALRIDANQDDARQRRLFLFLERGFRGGENLQCCRADVRAVGEAEKHEVPLACKYGLIDGRAVLIDKRERRHRVRIRQYQRKLGLRRCLHLQGHKRACGQCQPEGEGDNEFSWVHSETLRS